MNHWCNQRRWQKQRSALAERMTFTGRLNDFSVEGRLMEGKVREKPKQLSYHNFEQQGSTH